MLISGVDHDDFMQAMFPRHEIKYHGTYQGQPYFRCSCGCVLEIQYTDDMFVDDVF